MHDEWGGSWLLTIPCLARKTRDMGHAVFVYTSTRSEYRRWFLAQTKSRRATSKELSSTRQTSADSEAQCIRRFHVDRENEYRSRHVLVGESVGFRVVPRDLGADGELGSGPYICQEAEAHHARVVGNSDRLRSLAPPYKDCSRRSCRSFWYC